MNAVADDFLKRSEFRCKDSSASGPKGEHGARTLTSHNFDPRGATMLVKPIRNACSELNMVLSLGYPFQIVLGLKFLHFKSSQTTNFLFLGPFSVLLPTRLLFTVIFRFSLLLRVNLLVLGFYTIYLLCLKKQMAFVYV